MAPNELLIRVRIISSSNINTDFLQGWERLNLQVVDTPQFIFLAEKDIAKWEYNGFNIIKEPYDILLP